MCHDQVVDINIYSWACLIDEGDTFLLTGGLYTKTTVSRYNVTSHVKDLNILNSGRYQHACGWYVDSDGKRVSYILYSLTSTQTSNIHCIINNSSLFVSMKYNL